jgi:hypothetical protein
MSRFLPPDHSQGDERTIGGYERVHARPAALEGTDGFAYSVAILNDEVHVHGRPPYGAYFLFLRWRRVGEEGVEGHLESDFLEYAASREDAMQLLRAWPIEKVQAHLNAILEIRRILGVTEEDDGMMRDG